jgi:tetratricopeptide (TPR) repeat protein
MPFSRDSGQDESRNSKHNFVLGEQSLRAYLAGGNARFLDDAEANFDAIRQNDQWYDDAQFYLGITKTQLRKTDESIPIFEELRKRKHLATSNSDLAHKVALQLAYAHIKTYKDHGFQAAETQLEELEKNANVSGNRTLLAQSQAIHVFLYSVMAGHSEHEEKRSEFARKSLKLGKDLLRTSPFSPEITFEARNAIGIAWMRIAESNWKELGNRDDSWAKAQSNYDEALKIIPNSVRVLQNLAKLRLLQVAHGSQGDVSTLLAEAKDYCVRSLAVNDHDRYPYLELAQIAAAQGDAKAAIDAVRTGRTRPGAVDGGKWARVEGVAEDFVAKAAKSKLKDAVKPDDASARLILLYLDGKRNSWK